MMKKNKIILIILLIISGMFIVKFGFYQKWYTYQTGCNEIKYYFLGINYKTKSKNC